jgi:hypothetical protein
MNFGFERPKISDNPNEKKIKMTFLLKFYPPGDYPCPQCRTMKQEPFQMIVMVDLSSVFWEKTLENYGSVQSGKNFSRVDRVWFYNILTSNIRPNVIFRTKA